MTWRGSCKKSASCLSSWCAAKEEIEIAAKLERLEKEEDEEDDVENEVNLEQAQEIKSKIVKMVVDKWFVDKGLGLGKNQTGETIFIHVSLLQGGMMLMVGTDACAQVVYDDARTEEGFEPSPLEDARRGLTKGTHMRRTKWRNKCAEQRRQRQNWQPRTRRRSTRLASSHQIGTRTEASLGHSTCQWLRCPLRGFRRRSENLGKHERGQTDAWNGRRSSLGKYSRASGK